MGAGETRRHRATDDEQAAGAVTTQDIWTRLTSLLIGNTESQQPGGCASLADRLALSRRAYLLC